MSCALVAVLMATAFCVLMSVPLWPCFAQRDTNPEKENTA